MPVIWGQKSPDGSVRPYMAYQRIMEDVPLGVRLRVRIEEDRNGKFNSLYHVMLDRVARAVNRGPAHTDIDTLKRWSKIQTGRYDVVALPSPVDGLTHTIEYHSTSFGKMGEGEFYQFAVDTCNLIRDHLAPWISDSPEWPEIMQILQSIAPADQIGAKSTGGGAEC